jgi:hypothetical protein
MDEITKDTLIPNELAVKILDEITKLAEIHGLHRDVIKNGALRALIKWEEKNADKSGG